jgi:hypothetical protein
MHQQRLRKAYCQYIFNEILFHTDKECDQNTCHNLISSTLTWWNYVVKSIFNQ